MTTEHLLRIATLRLHHHLPLPLDLAARLLAEGIDITTLERKETP